MFIFKWCFHCHCPCCCLSPLISAKAWRKIKIISHPNSEALVSSYLASFFLACVSCRFDWRTVTLCLQLHHRLLCSIFFNLAIKRMASFQWHPLCNIAFKPHEPVSSRRFFLKNVVIAAPADNINTGLGWY